MGNDLGHDSVFTNNLSFFLEICKNCMPKKIDITKDIKRIIFNDVATIVFWKDGTKTVSKCHPEDEYSKEAGVMACMMKHYFKANMSKKLANFCK